MASRGILATFLALALLGAVCAPSALPSSAGEHGASVAKKKCKAKGKAGAAKKKKCKKKSTPAAQLAISPTSADYGFVVGHSSKTMTFTVTNSGGRSSGIPGISIQDSSNQVGNPVNAFFLASSSCDAALPPAASCNIDVSYEPPLDGTSGKATLTVSATGSGSASAQLTGFS